MNVIGEVHATGEEIEAIVNKIEPQILHEDLGHVVIALLSMVLISMKPDIGPDELTEKIRTVSQYICLILDDSDESGGQIVSDPETVGVRH